MLTEEQNRVGNVKKLVSNAKAILTNQIGLPVGVRKMTKIQHWINPALTEIDLKIFGEFDLAVGRCPIGPERLLWDKDALKIQDQVIDKVIVAYRDDIIDKCFEVVDLFDK